MMKSIMIVEDDRIVCHQLRSNLEAYGYKIGPVTSYGEEAVELAGKINPDIILMDIELKGRMDGIEAAGEIYQHFQIHSIFLTAYDDDDRIARAKVLMPFGYLIKPINPRQLRAVLEIAFYVMKIEAERNKADQVIKENDIKYEQLFNKFSIGVFRYDVFEEKIISVNSFGAKFLGYATRAECLAQYNLRKHHVDLELRKKLLEDLRNHRPVENLKCQFRSKDGTLHWGRLWAATDETGTKMDGFLLDITEATKVEDALRSIEKRFRIFLESSPYTFAIFDQQLNLLDIKMVEQSRVKKDDVIGKHILEISPDVVESGRYDQYLEVLKTGKSIAFDEVVFDSRYGGRIFKAKVFKTADGLGIITTDITELKKQEKELTLYRKQLEEMVKERTADLQEMVEKQHDTEDKLRTIIRAHQVLSSCNKAATQAKDEMHLLRDICRIIVEVGQYRMVWAGYAENDEKKSVPVVAYHGFENGYLENLDITWADTERGRGPTGTAIRTGKPSIARHYEADPDFAPWRQDPTQRGYRSGIALPLGQGETRIGAINIYSVIPDAFNEEEIELLQELADLVARSIMSLRAQALANTEKLARIEAEKQLEEQRLLSIRTDRLRSLGEMSAGVAHELNQPLSGVRGIAELLLISLDKGWDVSAEKLNENLALIIQQADRMSHIIEHVRLFAREAGKPEVSPVNINNVVTSAQHMLGEQFRAHGLKLTTDLADSIPMVQVNPFSLEEVLLNLLINARDAVEERTKGCPKPPPEIIIRTYVHQAGTGPSVCIQVRDNGIGMEQETLQKAFNPFFTTKGPDKGTGLGLSICKSIIESFEGSIRIDSDQLQGTTATVLLPSMPNPKEN